MEAANRILCPAYGTYVGNGLGNLSSANALPIYFGTVLAGQLNGRTLNRYQSDLAPRKNQ